MSRRRFRRSVIYKGYGAAGGRTLFARAKKEFGTTDIPFNAGYILPDGDLLDLSEGGGEGRSQDHRAVECLFRNLERSDAMLAFMKQGAIRLHSTRDGSLYLDIAEGYKPTHEQLAQIRNLAHYHTSATVEYTNPETGTATDWNQWDDEHTRYHPDSVLRWIKDRREDGLHGFGQINNTRITQGIFSRACKEAGAALEEFMPGGAGFILPDGCLVSLNDHEEIYDFYPKAAQEKLKRKYDVVYDAVTRGAVRVAWLPDENLMAFQIHKKPSAAQQRTIREMASWSEQTYVDLQDERGSISDAKGWPIFNKADPPKVLRWMQEKGYAKLGYVPDEQLFSCALQNHPPTDDPSCIGYILPDGRTLDMCGEGGRYPKHQMIQWCYPKEERLRGGDAVRDMLRRGAIRVHREPAAPETVVEFMKEPTSAQASSLRRYLQSFEAVWAERVDSKGNVLAGDSWGTGAQRYHPDAVINWMKGTSMGRGMNGLGALCEVFSWEPLLKSYNDFRRLYTGPHVTGKPKVHQQCFWARDAALAKFEEAQGYRARGACEEAQDGAMAMELYQGVFFECQRHASRGKKRSKKRKKR